MDQELQEQMRQDFVNRISKILLTPHIDSLQLDNQNLSKMPVNSDEPLFVAAEVFKDTLLGVGVSGEVTNLAKIAFYTMQTNAQEEV